MADVITLLTDFGNKDGYVGTIKGVIYQINPNVKIVDLSHSILQGDTNSAAFILAQSAPYFPNQTIHVAVVDPGVGSSRKALLVKTKNAYFIAPDNGLLKYIFSQEDNCQIFDLSNSNYFLTPVSNTFHGRDIFAPVAAHLSKGISPEKIGKITTDFEQGQVSLPIENRNEIVGKIIYIDHFGNLVSNIPSNIIKDSKEIKIGKISLSGKLKTYSNVNEFEPVALIGSHGYLEIAYRNGNAQTELGAHIGSKILIRK